MTDDRLQRDPDHSDDEEPDPDATPAAVDGSEGDDDVARTDEEAQAKLERLEEDPPKSLDDWPDDRTKYLTIGGTEGDQSYDEGPTAKLGPSDVRYHDDGSVEVKGETVDDPETYRGDPLPGGPTDPEAPTDPNDSDHERRQRERPQV